MIFNINSTRGHKGSLLVHTKTKGPTSGCRSHMMSRTKVIDIISIVSDVLPLGYHTTRKDDSVVCVLTWQRQVVPGVIQTPSLRSSSPSFPRHLHHNHCLAISSAWEFSLKFYLPGTHRIDLNISSLKWCSLNNCNWCVSLDIAYILALRNTTFTRKNESKDDIGIMDERSLWWLRGVADTTWYRSRNSVTDYCEIIYPSTFLGSMPCATQDTSRLWTDDSSGTVLVVATL